eukprot:TRINITY_DN20961_c0_g2_i1.p1 TRINITY_DN20961_c0_g2~~TRINITY_DN20961_c0_g2_i1.p1  ORF type:complete len:1156 (-),score=142.24 TRINITY_DN20961_c0_g2_i1:140-3583(-)
MKVDVEGTCFGGIAVKELGHVVCADGTDDVVFLEARVVGCDAKWSQPGLLNAESACASGYHICRTDAEAKQIGLTRQACESEPPQGTFYATREGNGLDDIYGCGQGGLGIDFAQKGSRFGVLNVKIGDKNFGAWRGLEGNPESEQSFVTKEYGNGGVMCCIDKAKGHIEFSAPSTRIWSDTQCKVLSSPVTSATDRSRVCTAACQRTEGCTAINWNTRSDVLPMKRCTVLACNYPIAKPELDKQGWRGLHVLKDTGRCDPVRGQSSYCSHGRAWCAYTAQEGPKGSGESCQGFCSRYDMTCLGEAQATDDSESGACAPLAGAPQGACNTVREAHICNCSKPLATILPCVGGTKCHLSDPWCQSFSAIGLELHFLCNVKFKSGQWWWQGEPTGVAFGYRGDQACDHVTLFCSGAHGASGAFIVGRAEEQALAVQKAIYYGGFHPRAPALKLPCVYQQCNAVRVRGAGLREISGLYYPTQRDCRGEMYGEARDGTFWKGYARKGAENEVFLVWDWRSNITTRGWSFMYKDMTFYHDALHRENSSKVLPLDNWTSNASVVAEGIYPVEPVPSIECVKLAVLKMGHVLEPYEPYVIPTSIGEEWWQDTEGRRIPFDLPLMFRGGFFIQLVYDTVGRYTLVMNMDAIVHVMLGCTWGGPKGRETDFHAIVAKELELQGFTRAREDITAVGRYCATAQFETDALQNSVFSRLAVDGSVTDFTLTKSVHPAVIVTPANAADNDIPLQSSLDSYSPASTCSVTSLRSVDLADFDLLDIVSSRDEAGLAFASSSKSSGCSVSEAGDAENFSATGKTCFFHINDGIVGDSSYWTPDVSDTARFVGVRLARLAVVYGVRASTMAVPPGFQVESVQDVSGNISRYFYAEDRLTHDYPLSPKLLAHQWRDGQMIWKGSVKVERVSGMTPESGPGACGSCNVRGSKATDPASSDWRVGDTVHIPSLMANPPGLHIIQSSNSEDRSGSSDMAYFKKWIHLEDTISTTGEQWRAGKLEWEGRIKLFHVRRRNACKTCDVEIETKGVFDSSAQIKTGDVIHLPKEMANIENRIENAAGSFKLQVTDKPFPSFNMPESKWCDIGELKMQPSNYSYMSIVKGPVMATGIRIVVSNPKAVIDELVVYGKQADRMLNAFGQITYSSPR